MYVNSAAYNSVMGATASQLKNRKPYTIGAIAYHEKNCNFEQVEFFKSELALIEKRIAKLEAHAKTA